VRHGGSTELQARMLTIEVSGEDLVFGIAVAQGQPTKNDY
jgi:hypothetical protein